MSTVVTSLGDSRDELCLYDVFISYRQVDPDCIVAEALQRCLERFRTPQSLVRAGTEPRLNRVFRDRSEFAASSNLGAEINDALRKSRYLVVVCSRQTPKSQWVAEEIETFKRLGRQNRILALLIDGEPGEAYPQPLLDPEGGSEPLAADIRSPTLRRSLRLLRKSEKLRILAAVLGVGYDDLWQRERRRTTQRRVIGAALSLALVATFGTLAWIADRQAHTRHLTTAVTNLAETSLRLADKGETGLAALLALQAQRFDPQDRLALESRIYKALWRSIAAPNFSQVLSAQNASTRSTSITVDGRYLAVGREDGVVEMWNLERSWEAPILARFEDASVRAVSFLPDGARLVVGLDEGEVWLCSVEGGSIRKSLLGQCSTVEALAVSPSGKLIAAGTQGDGICLLEPDRPGAVRWIKRDEGVRAVAFSPDGLWMASAGKEGVDLWATDDTRVSTRSLALPLNQETVHALAFTKRYLAAGSSRNFGGNLKQLLSNDLRSTSSEFRGLVRIWDLENMQQRPRILPADPQRVLALAFSPDGNRLASAGVGPALRLWTLDNLAASPLLLTGHAGDAVSLAFGAKGEMLASAGGSDGTVRLWRQRAPLAAEIRAEGAVLSLAFIGRDRLAAAVKMYQSPVVWDIRRHPPNRQGALPQLEGAVVAVASDAAHPGKVALGTRLLLGSKPDTNVRVWDFERGEFPIAPTVAHESAVDAVAFDTSGNWLASAGSLDRAVKLLDSRSGEITRLDLPPDVGAIHVLEFHPSGEPPMVAVGTDRAVVILPGRDRSGPTVIKHIFGRPTEDWSVRDLGFSPDGKWLATAAPDGKIRLWRTGEWKAPAKILEPEWSAAPVPVQQLSFGPDGHDLAVGYNDGAIRIWDMAELSRRPLIVEDASGTAVSSLAYHPDGTSLGAGFANGQVKVWPTLRALVQSGCDHMIRNLTAKEWDKFVGENLHYMRTCERFPSGR